DVIAVASHVSSLRMTWILRPATVSPCWCIYSLTAVSICLPVEANGPVMGRIKPILNGSAAWAVAATASKPVASTVFKMRFILSSPKWDWVFADLTASRRIVAFEYFFNISNVWAQKKLARDRIFGSLSHSVHFVFR